MTKGAGSAHPSAGRAGQLDALCTTAPLQSDSGLPRASLSQLCLENTFYLREACCLARHLRALFIGLAQGAWGAAPARAKENACWGAALAQATSLQVIAGWRLEINNQSQRDPRAELAQYPPFTGGNSEDQRRAMTCPRSHSTSAAEVGPATGPLTLGHGSSLHWGQVEQLYTSSCPWGDNSGVRKIACIWGIQGSPWDWISPPGSAPLPLSIP